MTELQLSHSLDTQTEPVRAADSYRFLKETPVVTKKEIVKQISEEIGLTQLKTKEIVQKTFDAIIETLVSEKRIELRNFGVFEVKKRAARKARNPRTGDPVDVAEKFVVTFKPGKEMEEKVLELDRAEEERQKAQSQSPPAVATQNPPDRVNHTPPQPLESRPQIAGTISPR